MVVREADERDRRMLSDLLHEAVTRRDFGRFMAIAAGLTGLTPTLVANAAGGSLPAARPAAKQDGGSGGTITFARSGDSDSLDPHHTIAGISWQVFTNIYDTLIAKNMDLEYEGILAESWEISEDGLEYTFHLRQRIKFHDGSDFNADSVKFTFDRVTNPETNAPAAPWASALKETVVVDPTRATEQLWQELEQDLTDSILNARLIVADHSGHTVNLSQPEIIVTAIQVVITNAPNH